ncbi:GTPase Era [Candidatus Xianfuyuplasma coldseepsis]|uniref:GTPase Era n=1 Tax=Candidatus Xianfuyuplasma coldseepsis TaxID=2782163 RepID=A0A7L7KU10_9MOLU|nr:GTPase Era [Xianfuyuplasma coldseepsis]QMS85909.1 GTPase Era [Xianfuyuplasma coldseepsis]
MFRSGFVTIIGRPNVGKSTFLNHVLGQKVTIISDKPQTTRNNISGIYTTDDAQIIFIDTPGIHKPHHKLGVFMTKEAINTLSSVDLILYMTDGNQSFGGGDEFIINELQRVKVPVFLIVNKADLTTNIAGLKQNIDRFKQAYNFKGIFSISALRGDNVERLLDDIKQELPEGPKYYPDDMITDHPEKFIISELVREKVLLLTKEEIPHSVMCLIDQMEYDTTNPRLINIHASIIVERPSQKGIIIGKNGRMIKQIGTLARQDILHLLGNKIFLDLHVKVVKDWRNKDFHLRNYGYTEEL